MKKKQWKLWVSIICIMVLLGGCSFLGSTSKEVSNIIDDQETTNEVEGVKEDTDIEDEPDALKDELIQFYRQFFTANEDDMLHLNAYPVKLTEGYWDEYDQFKSHALKLLNGFMSLELEEKLEKQFLTTNIHFPRFIEVNGKVIINYLDVEDIDYQTIGKEEQRYTLLTDVIVKAEVISRDQFNALYRYDDEKNNYIKNSPDSVIEVEDKDTIKVKCAYIIEFEQNDKKELSIISLKENGEVLVPEENRRNIINNDFVQRAYYIEEPLTEDSTLIKVFLNKFMNQDKDSYQYYQYAYDMDIDIFKQMLIDLELNGFVLLDEQNYKNQFPKTIIPTKDEIISIHVKEEDIEVNVHVDTSKKSRKYIIKFLAKVKLSDYTTEDMMYKYFVTIEDHEEESEKITSIQYAFMEPINALEEQTDGNEDNENTEENAKEPSQE